MLRLVISSHAGTERTCWRHSDTRGPLLLLVLQNLFDVSGPLEECSVVNDLYVVWLLGPFQLGGFLQGVRDSIKQSFPCIYSCTNCKYIL